MIGYKLTTQNMQTYGGCQWRLNQPKTTDGEGELCGPGWLHYYKSPLLALLHNPIHADIEHPRLFRVEADGEHKHDGDMKSGCTKLTLLEELPVPKITPIQRTAYGILCAKAVCINPAWNVWADSWLDGTDRSEEAAWASWAAAEAVRAAALAAEAWAATRAAAAWAAEAVLAAEAWAAEAAEAALAAAAQAAAENLDLQAMAERAMEVV